MCVCIMYFHWAHIRGCPGGDTFWPIKRLRRVNLPVCGARCVDAHTHTGRSRDRRGFKSEFSKSGHDLINREERSNLMIVVNHTYFGDIFWPFEFVGAFTHLVPHTGLDIHTWHLCRTEGHLCHPKPTASQSKWGIERQQRIYST